MNESDFRDVCAMLAMLGIIMKGKNITLTQHLMLFTQIAMIILQMELQKIRDLHNQQILGLRI